MSRFDKRTRLFSLMTSLFFLLISIGTSTAITTTTSKRTTSEGKSSSTSIGILTSTGFKGSTAKTTTQSSTLTNKPTTTSFSTTLLYSTNRRFTPATPPSRCPFKYDYIGCYADKVSMSDLNGLNANYTAISSDPIKECAGICIALRFVYAGIQRGGQCYCGNSYGAYGVANGKNVTCNIPCTGNSKAICGGNFANSIYKVKYLAQCQFTYQYRGCYTDQPLQRDLDGLRVSTNTVGGGSVEKCGEMCLNLNFTYCGLQNGNECYCGNSFGAYNASFFCHSLCLNNPAQFCGGNYVNIIFQTTAVITNNCYSNPCFNGGTCYDFLSGFYCSCTPSFMGAQCKDSAIWVKGYRLPDYSSELAEIENFQTAIQAIKTTADFLKLSQVDTKGMASVNAVIGKVVDGLGLLADILEFLVPSETELILEYMKQQFEIINEKLDAIFHEILYLEDMIATYMNRISNQIQNLQVVVNAVSNINRMNAYNLDAKNMITDLQVYLSAKHVDKAQISDTCGTFNNPQHYLNIINHFASASIFDSSQGSDYNLMYNVMAISNFADYQTLTLWYQKMLSTAFSLVYYGQICDAAKNKTKLYKKESAALMNKTFTSIISGFQNQMDELRNKTLYGSYVGCFRDHDTVRDLPYVLKRKTDSMSVQYCINRCNDYGFLYAGLQQGTDCWCGNNYGMHGSVDFSQCTNLCSDMSRTFCGGNLTNLVFKTSLSAPQNPTKTWTVFFDSGNSRVYFKMPGPISDDTIEIHYWRLWDNYQSRFFSKGISCSECSSLDAQGRGSLFGYLFKSQVTTPFFTTAPWFLDQQVNYNQRFTRIYSSNDGPSERFFGYYIIL